MGRAIQTCAAAFSQVFEAHKPGKSEDSQQHGSQRRQAHSASEESTPLAKHEVKALSKKQCLDRAGKLISLYLCCFVNIKSHLVPCFVFQDFNLVKAILRIATYLQ